MPPEIKKILYATDLSRNAAYAFRYAMRLAQQFDATVTILHIIEKMSADAQLAFLAYLDKSERRRISDERVKRSVDRIRERLEKFCEKELQGQSNCRERVEKIEVYEGYPAEQILEQAVHRNCDLIVMGAHEKGLNHTFLGSVAKSVLRRSRIPTFVVPLPKEEIDLSFDDA